ncbi:MAG: hypothetical protein ABGX21_01425 [Candidatus Poseidoniia archaeon]|jgi:hypothetical protein
MDDKWGKWIASKCTRYFDSIEDATDYLNERDYSGKVLRSPEGIIVVCCAYPDGFYQDVVTVVDICDGSEADSLTEEENAPISCDCSSP